MRLHRTTVLAASGLAAIATLSACPSAKEDSVTVTRFFPQEQTTIGLNLVWPAGGAIDSTCAGAQAFLLRINTDGTSAWQYTLLFNQSRTEIYGCEAAPNQPCPAGTTFLEPLTSIRRVMVEGVDVTPEAFASASHDVVCRGVADADVVAESIAHVEATPTPVPQETQTYVITHAFTVNVDMLRIGAGNALPMGDVGIVPIDRRFGAAASFSEPGRGIGVGPGGPRGRIVLAGGVSSGTTLPNEIWEFDAQRLEFSTSSTTLTAGAQGVAGLSATTYVHGIMNPQPAVLFAGGLQGSTLQTNALTYRIGSSTRLATVAARAFHSAAYLGERNGDDAVVALLGGLGGTVASGSVTFGTGPLADYEYYFTPESYSIGVGGGCPGANPGPATGAFCKPTTDPMVVPHGLAAGILYFPSTPDDPNVWLAGGSANGASTSISSTENFAGAGDGSFTANTVLDTPALGAAGVVFKGSGNTTLDGKPVVIGGLSDSSAPNAITRANVRITVADSQQLTSQMRRARGLLQATPLRDRTMLITGGRDAGAAVDGIAPVEVLVAATNGVANSALATFRFMPTPTGACDPTSTIATGCATLLDERWGHTATRLDETQTWLDGAVLVAGGSTGGLSAELFVPALLCSAANLPVSPVTLAAAEPLSNPSLADTCDLGRDPFAITDPANP